MRTLVFYICLLLMISCPKILFGQGNLAVDQPGLSAPVEDKMKNFALIQEIYDLLQDESAGPQDVIVLAPFLDWEEELIPNGFDSRHKLTLHAVMNGKWTNLSLKDFNFAPGKEEMIVVTGTIEGRQPSECEYLSHLFRHFWVFDEDRLVYFWE